MFRYDEATAELFLYGDIFPSEFGGVDDVQVLDALMTMKDRRVTARINSNGGSVTIMRGIYNALERHPGGVDTVNDGMAASAGHYIFMVGENRTMARNASGFVHQPMTLAIGNAREFREVAEALESIGSTMAETYAEKTGRPMSQILDWLDGNTWFNAKESIDSGMATAIGNVVVSDTSVAASRESIMASIAEGKPFPQQSRQQVEQVAPYRVAAKLKLIRSRNNLLNKTWEKA